jgi:adenylosuccinate synthase
MRFLSLIRRLIPGQRRQWLMTGQATKDALGEFARVKRRLVRIRDLFDEEHKRSTVREVAAHRALRLEDSIQKQIESKTQALQQQIEQVEKITG